MAEQRMARCAFYGQKPGPRHEGPCGRNECKCEEPTSGGARLFALELKPDQPYDKFYCGCAFGWD